VVLARLGRRAAQPDATAVRLAGDSSGSGAMSGVVVVFILGCVLAAGVGTRAQNWWALADGGAPRRR
jgi:hypothetical protein